MRRREHCAACGFDSDLYSRGDTITSQHVVAAVLRAAIEGLDGEALHRRPDDTTWSIAEYIDHVRETTFGNRFAIGLTLETPGIDLGTAPASSFAERAKDIDVTAALDGVEAEFDAMRELLQGLDRADWDTSATLDGKKHTVGWFARHVVHDGLHHLGDIGRIRHRFGLGAPSSSGQLEQISVSGGGVPKLPVESAEIGPAGVGGDAQADRRHHGRPLQAVCLWGADVIAGLQAKGHPIAAGNAGENLTIAGIDWAALRPGSRITVGAVPMLITAHAIPCAKNAQWFADRDFKRILHERNPGFSRLYAIPLATGIVTAGDRVHVEP